MIPLVPPVVSGLPAQQPQLTAGELLLRPWQPTDAGALLTAYADPAIQRWHVETIDVAGAARYAQVWADAWLAGQRAGWAVVDRGALVGRTTLRGIDLEQGQGELTYWVVPAARGRGVAPSAAEAVVAWAFALGFRRLTLNHSTLNGASCRVADKLGFTLEGTRRSAGLHIDGWHDMHLHARLSQDRPTG